MIFLSSGLFSFLVLYFCACSAFILRYIGLKLKGIILFLRYLFVLAMALSLSGVSSAADNDAAASSALTQLVDRLTKIETISGAFVQFSVDQKGVRLQESKGEFKAQRPGKFYWHTESPLEQSIYSDGKTVTVYDPDLEQATIQKLSNEISATPAVLFSGDTANIGEQFNVDVRVWDEIVTQFLLTPKTSDSLFEKMILKFEGAQLAEMRLSDSLGQENSVSFVRTQLNQKFSEQDFQPILPEGTDIIRDLPAQALN